LILFLFFNASLIEKCKALKIKIKVLNFINDINILIYLVFLIVIAEMTLSTSLDNDLLDTSIHHLILD